jgi:hypothetical protein
MRGVVLLLALSTIGCNLTGPDDDLSGTWVARSIGHASFVGFTLRQTGDAISGTACATSESVLLYTGAAVTGDYPDLRFTVAAGNTAPCCAQLAGTRFIGKRDSTKDIVGNYGTFDLRFERSEASLCPENLPASP